MHSAWSSIARRATVFPRVARNSATRQFSSFRTFTSRATQPATRKVVGGAACVVALASSSFVAFASAEANPDEEPQAELDVPVVSEEEAESDEPTESTQPKKRRKKRRRRRVRELTNPGKLEEFCKESMEILRAEPFSGAKAEISVVPIQLPAKQMQFMFSTHMDPSSYRDKRENTVLVNVQNETMMLLGKLDSHLGLFGRAIFPLSEKLAFSYMMQFAEESHVVCDLIYSGKDFTGGAKYMFAPNGHTLGANYFQSVTPCCALGVELNNTIDQGAVLAFTGRYAHFWNKTKKGDIATFQLDERGILMGNYTHKLDEHLSLSTEMTILPPRQMNEGGFPVPETVVQVGALYKGYNCFKYQGSFKTSGDVTSILDYMIVPSVTLQLSGVLNHFTDDSKFGIGLRVGGQ